MSKHVKMSARAKAKPDPDQWVENREGRTESKKRVKPKRLTIDINPELHRKLKLSCVQRNIQIADLVRSMIERDLEAN